MDLRDLYEKVIEANVCTGIKITGEVIDFYPSFFYWFWGRWNWYISKRNKPYYSCKKEWDSIGKDIVVKIRKIL